MNARNAIIDGLNNYLSLLNDRWADHVAPRSPDAPSVISLFAGCGGSSLGYSMAGFKELLAVERDSHAVAVFKMNFPDVPIHHGDIEEVSVERVLEQTGLLSGQLDVLDGSPPCQGFSTVGRRILDDPRNQLFKEYLRLLRGLRPKIFVMENVSGMVKGKMKLIFAEIIRELKASGYCVSARLMNVMYFGIPQTRERMIFIGVREGLDISPSHPMGTRRTIGLEEIIPHAKPSREGWGPTDISKVRIADFANKWRSVLLPCPTIVKTRPPILLLNNGEQREMTSEECARAGAFPDQYQWIGSEAQRINRIGNSVPPLFMYAIARYIKENLLNAVDGAREHHANSTQEN